MDWIEPIFDRKEIDIEKLKEYELIGYQNLTLEQKEEWNSELIGALNNTDLNRIENNSEYLSDIFRIAGQTFKTWGKTDILTLPDEQRILENINEIKNKYIFVHAPPEVEPPLNEYEKINILEKILYDMYHAISGEIEDVVFETSDGDSFETSDGNIFSTFEPIPIDN